MEKRLFLLDAYALIYRAYYALLHSRRVTSKGFNTSAIFGFCNTLDELLRKEDPTHIAVCFDPPGGHTFRHEEYKEYKAQRDKQPEDITESIPYIKRILEAYRIPIIEVEGFEADDVIGTLSVKAEEKGYDTYMMTPDKDYGQLVTDHVYMYRPSLKGEGFEVRDPKVVCAKYGISNPRQVIDLLALEGDASDNIPGCPGVGEKTAQKLIEEWGSVENLLENTDKLKKSKLQERLIENADKIRMSKYLATIKTDVPLDIDIDSLKRKPLDVESLTEIYKELEFRTFLSRIKSPVGSQQTPPASKSENASEPVAAQPTSEGGMGSLFDMVPDDNANPQLAPVCETREYVMLNTPDKIAEVIASASSQPAVGVSLYAVGEEAMTARWLGVAIAWEPCKGYYISAICSR